MSDRFREHLLSVFVLAVALALLAASAMLLAPAKTQAATHVVTIQDNSFVPSSLTIAVGDTVEWRNDGISAHTTTRNVGPESWNSGTMMPGDSFSHTFSEPGTYIYECLIHFGMSGTIVVGSDGESPTTTPSPTASATPEATSTPPAATPTPVGTPTATTTPNPNVTPFVYLPVILNSSAGW